MVLFLNFLFQGLILIAQSGQKNFIDQNYIEITGNHELELTPDEIYISITINEADTKGKTSVEKLENKMIEQLENLDVNLEEDFKIKDFSSNFKNYFLRKNTVLKSKQYQLLVHSGLELGLVFQKLEAIGISNIQITKVSHSELKKYEEEVKVLALVNAKERSVNYANAIGQTSGKALFVQVYQQQSPRNYNRLNKMVMMDVAKSKEETVNDLEFEKIKIQATVLTRFEVK